MGKKEEIAEIFYKIADILEMENVKWKPQAYRIAARSLEDLGKDIEEIYTEKGISGIKDIPGIGEGLAKKIVQYIKEGKIKEFEKLKKTLPAGIVEMMDIPGIGPKKARVLYEKLGIKNINELEKAAKRGKIHTLPMFKEKTEKNILDNIQLYKSHLQRMPLSLARKESKRILNILKKLPGVKRFSEAGSVRRRLPTIGDLDLLVSSAQPKKVVDKFVSLEGVKKILAKGSTKASVLLKNNLQIDLRVIPDNEYGSALQYLTGNKAHNIILRKLAIKKGLKLSEYGLFKGKKRIAGKTEDEVYSALGLITPKPEKRAGKTEFRKK